MMTVILITCVMARGKDGAFASNWVATRIIFAPSRSFSSAWGFFLLDRKFLRNSLSNKKLSEGSHCGGYVDVASATAAGGESCKEEFFLTKKSFYLV